MEGKIGAEGSYKLEVQGGNLLVSVKQDGTDGKAALELSFEIEKVLKEIAAKTENKWDDSLVNYLVALLKIA